MAENDKIKITWDDIDRHRKEHVLQEHTRPSSKTYGRISRDSVPKPGANVLYSSPLYTGVAGLIGAFAGWGVTELLLLSALSQGSFITPVGQASIFFGVIGMFLGATLCAVEGVVSRTYLKSLQSGLIGLGLGCVGGVIAGGTGQALYGSGSSIRQNVVLLLDTSSSMEGRPLSELKRASKRFVSDCEEHNISVGLVSFSDEAHVLSEVADRKRQLQIEIDHLVAFGLTNMQQGLKRALTSLEGREGQNSILLFSDGMPTVAEGLSVRSLPQMIQDELKKRGLTEEQFLTLAIRKRGFTANDLNEMSKAQIGELAKQIYSELGIGEAIEDEREQVESQTLAEARRVRDRGVRIVAIGTGEADRGFLSRVTGEQFSALYADSPAGISKAFVRAKKILFRESSAARAGRLVGLNLLIRSLCWGLVGLLLGLAQGIAMRSGKKMRNALIGALAGGLVGGFLFDPIGAIVHNASVSRIVAVAVIGGCMGTMIGLVESLLKDAWLKVVRGRLAGKEFVLYRNPTILGSSPKCEIYLFKDESVEPRHAAISTDGRLYVIEDLGSEAGTFVNNQRISRRRLRSEDEIQVGKTRFIYREKTKKR